MTNDEKSTKSENKRKTCLLDSLFGFHSSFVIRDSVICSQRVLTPPEPGGAVSADTNDASRAGVWPGGQSVFKYATRAVVCAGERFLPYAGIFPRPCSTCLINWSSVSRVATASRAGPRCPPSPPRLWQFRHCM